MKKTDHVMNNMNGRPHKMTVYKINKRNKIEMTVTILNLYVIC